MRQLPLQTFVTNVHLVLLSHYGVDIIGGWIVITYHYPHSTVTWRFSLDMRKKIHNFSLLMGTNFWLSNKLVAVSKL